MSRPEVGDRFPLTADVEAEASNVIHAILEGTPHVSGASDWEKLVKAGPLPADGTYRVRMVSAKHFDFTGTVYMQVRRNGDEIGEVLENDQDQDVKESKTQKLTFEEGDNIELWGYSTDGWTFRIEEFWVGSSLGIEIEDLT